MPAMPLGKDLARDAMQKLRDYPHPLARPLALCFVFDSANAQFVGATCLELGLTLDAALTTPSESLLAVIRLQWWIDAIQDTAPAHAPLVQNLRILIENQPDMRDRLIHVIGQWQNACHVENRNSQPAWQALWQLLAERLGQPIDTVAAIGPFCLSLDAPPPPDIINKKWLLDLRHTGAGESNQWPYLLACFGLYQRSGNQPLDNVQHSTLLGWRVLFWWLGLPPSACAAVLNKD